MGRKEKVNSDKKESESDLGQKESESKLGQQESESKLGKDEKVKASKSNLERVKTEGRNASNIRQPVHQLYTLFLPLHCHCTIVLHCSLPLQCIMYAELLVSLLLHFTHYSNCTLLLSLIANNALY